jgi:CP family cyanate transporter-like MFS transporter
VSAPRAAPHRAGSLGRPLILFAGLLLAALSLRTAMGSVPPILSGIRDEFALTATTAGVLVSLPLLCLGFGAPLGPALGRRLGDVGGLAACMIALAVGALLRAGPGPAALFAGTVVASVATGIAGVLVPAIAKRLRPDLAGTLTGIYTMLLVTGTALSAGLAVPIADAFGGEVRPALAVWALPALAAGLLLGMRRTSAPRADLDAPRVQGWIWRDTVARQVTAFLTQETVVFYSLFSWLPSVAQSYGVSPATAGAALGLFSLVGIPMSLAVPALADRRRTQGGMAAVLSVISICGLFGLLVSTGDGFLVWTIVLGIAQGGAFGLALALLALRAPDGPTAAELSGMAQTTAYLVAAAAALLLGVLHDATGSWTPVLLVIVAVCAGQLLTGLVAGRDRSVVPPHPAPERSPTGWT